MRQRRKVKLRQLVLLVVAPSLPFIETVPVIRAAVHALE
jgi:hypothetical protein